MGGGLGGGERAGGEKFEGFERFEGFVVRMKRVVVLVVVRTEGADVAVLVGVE